MEPRTSEKGNSVRGEWVEKARKRACVLLTCIPQEGGQEAFASALHRQQLPTSPQSKCKRTGKMLSDGSQPRLRPF